MSISTRKTIIMLVISVSTFLLITQLNAADLSQSSGLIDTVAGTGVAGFSGDGGPAISAQINQADGIAVDSSGNLYIADTGNHRIRKVTPDGVITTVAGNGIQGYSGDGGPAASAQLSEPTDVALDPSGNLYIADLGNSRVRKVTPAGVISTITTITWAPDIAVDSAGNLYVNEHDWDYWWMENSRIYKVTPDGVKSVVAGNDPRSWAPQDGAPATSVYLPWTSDVEIDPEGNIYIAIETWSGDPIDYWGWIAKVTPDGILHLIAGGGYQDPGDEGPALSVTLLPEGLALDKQGNIYVSDGNTSRILKVTADGMIATIAGNGTEGFSGDGGPANLAQLNKPADLAFDPLGHIYVEDTSNSRIRKIELVPPPAYFPQVAVGGGWSTVFAVINTGAVGSTGNLIIRDPEGNPLTIDGELTDSFGTTHQAQAASSFSFDVPSGGTVFLSATAAGGIQTGWAQLVGPQDSLSGMVTYEYAGGASAKCFVSVPQSKPVQSAMIPVDMDISSGTLPAYAIMNPNNQAVSVNLVLRAQDGTVVDDSITISLRPGEQIARYLVQDLEFEKFRGSLIFRSKDGQTFVAFALLDKQGMLTPIPLFAVE
jgi:hypothetical protein